MINLTENVEIQSQNHERVVLTYHVRLDKNTILETLKYDKVYIDGYYYKTPESKLMECLLNRRFGEIKLDLERIPDQNKKA